MTYSRSVRTRPHGGSTSRLCSNVAPSRARSNRIRAVLDSARAVMVALGTPKSLAVEIILRSGDLAALMQLSWSPLDYTEDMWQKAKSDLQAVSLLKKATYIDVGVDTQLAALDRWVEAERGCARANDSLTRLWYSPEANHLKSTLLKAKIFIEGLLGRAPKFSELDWRHGPGASALCTGWFSPPKKFGTQMCCSPELVPYLLDLRTGLCPISWIRSTMVVVDGGTLSFVLKNYKTKRPIDTQPDENIRTQLGIGGALRSRLRKWIDLNSQADVNRVFASAAYDSGLSTIDLSSASDTICETLVNILFPEDWLELMDACRCGWTSYEGRSIKLEKYSSMGNGFTFELETIIFFALAVASGADPSLTCVFGDDIIVERALASDVISTLEACGFKVNADKSFVDGLFFESCGHDFFCGRNIRPVIWPSGEGDETDDRSREDDPVLTHCDLNVMVNGISRMAQNHYLGSNSTDIVDGLLRALPFEKAHRILVNLLKQEKAYFCVPIGWEDAGVVTSFDEATPSALGSGMCGFRFKALKYVSATENHSTALTGLLYSLFPRGREPTVQRFVPSRDWKAVIKLPPATGGFPSERHAVRRKGVWRKRELRVFGHWLGTGAWV